MTVAEVFIREADFFRAEEQRHALGLKALANRGAGILVQAAHWLLQDAIAHGGGSNYEGAVGDGIGDGLVFLGTV